MVYTASRRCCEAEVSAESVSCKFLAIAGGHQYVPLIHKQDISIASSQVDAVCRVYRHPGILPTLAYSDLANIWDMTTDLSDRLLNQILARYYDIDFCLVVQKAKHSNQDALTETCNGVYYATVIFCMRNSLKTFKL